ncbi:MAG TPA: LON peptidase substrate-binding domain-containing protein, partial [Candidatus Sumerlaeota bacterium]|nr:LON peptidase substrate-binding domain-containing protein [Candidatus Sumerlaeota bacterium]
MTDESNVSIDDMTKIIRGEQMEIPEELPILDFDNFVLFPFMIAPLVITNEHHKQIIDEAIAGNRPVGVFLSDEQAGGTPRLEKTGCAAMILKMLKIPDGTLRILIHGLKRIHVTEIRLTAPWLKAAIRTVEEITPVNITIEALMHQTREMLQRAITMSNLPEELGVAAHNMTEPGKLADLVATNLRLKIQEQQAILDTTNCQERLERVLAILAREVEILEMGDRIRSKVKSQV